MRKPAVAAFLFTLVGLATGAGDAPAPTGSGSAAQAVAQGQAAYGPGRWDEALADFDRPRSRDRRRRPSRATTPRPHCFSLVAMPKPASVYLEARERADRSLRTKIDYALGNTALAEGDIPGAIRSYDDCVGSNGAGSVARRSPPRRGY